MSYGPTVKVPFGPQHPALKEPEFFLFEVDGETVVDVKPRIGYVHRGIEKAFELRTYIQNIYLAERICGICSHAHTTCYTQAIEEL
ncbi:NADH dehydrogenase subunit, partial [Candidatus Bathyarchaeota archaeon]|nr:NADH dehydrogenase subunit [Candidatus Bathyarchaeota archaeon]